MKNIEYKSPAENKQEVGAAHAPHTFEIVIDGKPVGCASLDYYSEPLPLYELTALDVDEEHTSRGYGSEIMDQVEAWLISRKKPGMLIDDISEEDPAYGMYERRGWQRVYPNRKVFVYNWPKDVDPQQAVDSFYKREEEKTIRKNKRIYSPPPSDPAAS